MRVGLINPSYLFIFNDLAERVGFSKAVCYSSRAFNKMPETVVLTASYVLSHLEQQSQKETLINDNWIDYGMDGMDLISPVTRQTSS